VNSFTEALWYELRGSGVTATVSCPGATATEFATVAGNARSLLFRLGAASAATVARQGYRAMMKGKPMVIHGLKNKLTVQSLRVSPRALARAVAASFNPRPAPNGGNPGGAIRVGNLEAQVVRSRSLSRRRPRSCESQF